MRFLHFSITAALLPILAAKSDCPPPPAPEPITVVQLQLPPVAPSNDTGACSTSVNPRRTGCIDQHEQVTSGNFLPDNNHVIAALTFTGAPEAPDPASIYSGRHLVILRSNGTTFANGDAWRCITCGIPPSQRNGSTALDEYPQGFTDGRRVLIGNNVVDGKVDLASESFNASDAWIYPIRWDNVANNSAPGGPIRELRLHPDQVHLGFNTLYLDQGVFGQASFLSRLSFNPAPTMGTPMVPRYDLVNVTQFFNIDNLGVLTAEDDKLLLNQSAITVGEFRGFASGGKEITYVGPPVESGNIDVFAVGLSTGIVRRLTESPGYADPIDSSWDGEWIVVEDTRCTNRSDFIDGMRHVPPVTDLVGGSVATSVRNNGRRRFLQPWLLDACGDRGDYIGQQINAGGNGSAGAVNDPNWNSWADPRFSFDGTKIAFYQSIVETPACGGINPLPCPLNTNAGQGIWRVMVAHLTSRKPVPFVQREPISDHIPWGTPYVVGSTLRSVPAKPPPGNYTLDGRTSGFAKVELSSLENTTQLTSVSIDYYNYSDVPGYILNGYEYVAAYDTNVITTRRNSFFVNVTQTGTINATRITSPGGYNVSIDILTNILDNNGSYTTTINGVPYSNPASFT